MLWAECWKSPAASLLFVRFVWSFARQDVVRWRSLRRTKLRALVYAGLKLLLGQVCRWTSSSSAGCCQALPCLASWGLLAEAQCECALVQDRLRPTVRHALAHSIPSWPTSKGSKLRPRVPTMCQPDCHCIAPNHRSIQHQLARWSAFMRWCFGGSLEQCSQLLWFGILSSL